MSINITNRMATALGLWGRNRVYSKAQAMGGTTSVLTNNLSAQIISILVKAKKITAIDNTPYNTVRPAVTGTPEVASVLTTTNGTWTGSPAPGFTRKWQSSPNGVNQWTDISPAASGLTYTVASGDVGRYIRCHVTGTNTSGSKVATSPAVGPVVA